METEENRTQGPQIRVLCVDDSSDLTALFEILIGMQPDLVSVGSLQRANDLIAEVRHRRADVVVIDLNMPGLPPPQTIRTLREQVPECKVIVYSGDSQVALDEAKTLLNAHACVSKGEDPAVLLNAIRTAGRTNPRSGDIHSKL